MEEIKTKGIVIKATDFSDSDKIVTIFSYDFGIIKARIRGVKKKGAKLAFAVQPFAFIEFLLIKNKGFYSIVNATSIDQFFNITTDFDNYILMLSVLEVCEKSIKENDCSPEMFLLVLNVLKQVSYNNVSAMAIFIKFMLEAFRYLGFEMQVELCACCGNNLSKIRGFSFEYNGMICGKCQNNNSYLELLEGEYAILKNIDNFDIENILNLKFSLNENLISIINLLAKNFRLLTEEEITTLKQFL